jgi:Tfp pilus assembly protein PilE
MRKTTSGFTIVELVIVCIIIVILATISTVAYIGYQNQAKGQRARAMAALVASAAEKYYQDNGGYPDATILGTTANNGIPFTNDTQRASVASILNIDASALKVNDTELVVCADQSCSITNPNYVYYVPRTIGAPYSSLQDYDLGSPAQYCHIQFPAVSAGSVDADNSSYFITYRDPQSNAWKSRRSNNGTVTVTTSAYCVANSIFNDN